MEDREKFEMIYAPLETADKVDVKRNFREWIVRGVAS